MLNLLKQWSRTEIDPPIFFLIQCDIQRLMSSEAKEIMLNPNSVVRLEIANENHKNSFKRNLLTKKAYAL